MSGKDRLSREQEQSSSLRQPKINLGLIVMLALAALALVVALVFPEAQMPTDLPSGP
jgi:hypothetical protein